MFEIKDRDGNLIRCKNVEDAMAILRHLRNEYRKVPDNSHMSMNELLTQILRVPGQTQYWNRESFHDFIDSLGQTQKEILSKLVELHKISDIDLRKIAGVRTNLELGGILSGISKQAGSHNIPARAVYVIENEAQGGELSKYYVVANEFLNMALEMNWPS